MLKIILACDAGMSTSIMVTKMRQAAVEKKIEVEIEAVPLKFLSEHLPGIDVVLLGPQMRYTLKKVQKELEAENIPVDVINSVDYGMMRGDKVLDQAIELLQKHSG